MDHSEFIDALGGTAKVARMTGRDMCTVSIWRKKKISWMMRPFLAEKAKEMGVEIPDGFLDPMRNAK